MYCAMKEGSERSVYARRERRRRSKEKRTKRRFRVRDPMCRLLRAEVLAFARSFFAFCAIAMDLKRYGLLIEEGDCGGEEERLVK